MSYLEKWFYKDLAFIYRNKHQNEKFSSIKFPFVQLKKPTTHTYVHIYIYYREK